jgi:hypothetical protein
VRTDGWTGSRGEKGGKRREREREKKKKSGRVGGFDGVRYGGGRRVKCGRKGRGRGERENSKTKRQQMVKTRKC